jgi:hypothetical protein
LINYVIDLLYENWSFRISMVRIIFMILGFSALFSTNFVLFSTKRGKNEFLKSISLKGRVGGGGGGGGGGEVKN